MIKVVAQRALMVIGVLALLYCLIRGLEAGHSSPTTAIPAGTDEAQAAFDKSSDSPEEAKPNQPNESEPTRPIMPSYSGLQLHAMELWQFPNKNTGLLLTLDGRSSATLGPQSIIHYQWYGKKFAVMSREIGLRYNRSLSEGVCLFDVIAHPWTGFDADHVPDAQVVGQIVVEMNAPGLLPDPLELWDVEPKGTIEGTTETGIVIRIPIIHFWRYHETGEDAEAPVNVVIPPQHPR